MVTSFWLSRGAEISGKQEYHDLPIGLSTLTVLSKELVERKQNEEITWTQTSSFVSWKIHIAGVTEIKT